MITLRGHDALISTKMQLQLGLRETALSKLLGGQVISDMAVVGKDLYMREGAAIGVLFEAKNALLPNELIKQRNAAMKELNDPAAKTESITVAGKSVSFASTPDNRMRSFFASRDSFHLVTNCLAMVEQFLTDGHDLPIRVISFERVMPIRGMTPMPNPTSLLLSSCHATFSKSIEPPLSS